MNLRPVPSKKKGKDALRIGDIAKENGREIIP
jgi:hypothetical protein